MNQRVREEGSSIFNRRWFRLITLWVIIGGVLGLEVLIIPATGIADSGAAWKTVAKVVAVAVVIAPVFILAPWVKRGK